MPFFYLLVTSAISRVSLFCLRFIRDARNSFICSVSPMERKRKMTLGPTFIRSFANWQTSLSWLRLISPLSLPPPPSRHLLGLHCISIYCQCTEVLKLLLTKYKLQRSPVKVRFRRMLENVMLANSVVNRIARRRHVVPSFASPPNCPLIDMTNRCPSLGR